jgi:hypothetical protein
MNVEIESALAIVHERIFVTEMEALPLLPHRAAARGLRLAAEDRCLR